MSNDQKSPRGDNFKGAKGGDNMPVIVNDKSQPEAVQAQPLEVKVYNNNIEKAMRAFRALVQKERIISLYKEKQTYEKKSDKIRRKKNESERKRYELETFGPKPDKRKEKDLKKEKSENI